MKQSLTVNIATHIVVTIKIFEDLKFVKSNMVGYKFSDNALV